MTVDLKTYKEFLKNKIAVPQASGFDVPNEWLELESDFQLFPFQRDIVTWALRLGKAALFEQVGMGKTAQQLVWARAITLYTGKPVIIFAPLAVSAQTIREGQKFGISVKRVDNQDEADMWIENGQLILISNYERLLMKNGDYRFDTDQYAGVVLDESSIIKSMDGKIKTAIFDGFANTPYKLACSATPAPNDHMELGQHAEFLTDWTNAVMLAKWFTHNSGETHEWRLKHYGRDDFWRWLTSWAVCVTRPSDLGDEYDLAQYELPKLHIVPHFVPANEQDYLEAMSNGRLIPETTVSSTTLGKAKRKSLDDRLKKCIGIVDSIDSHEPIIIWYNLLDEMKALKNAFPDAIVVQGGDKASVKEQRLLDFSDKKFRILITHPKIAGHGMNWQHCNQMIYFGLDFSFEGFYQTKGRIHRYGQTRECYAHVIYSELEGNVISTLERKQEEFATMQHEMATSMKIHGLFRYDTEKGLKMAKKETINGKNWTLHLGDCVERIQELADESIDMSVYSPPFSNLYVYSDNQADMGNAHDDNEFFEHYKFLVSELFRITKTGRLSVVHVSDLPTFKGRDGFIGIKDFSGDVIKAHEYFGWIYHSRVTIWKNPVVEMQRTKALGLLHKQFKKDSSKSKVGMPDYLLVFRKDGDCEVPVTQNREYGDYIGTDEFVADRADSDDSYSINLWQRYASPVWFDIDQSNVLNYRFARNEKDERHIAPLQLDVIKRSIDLWSNKGDTIFTPFAGIGSELYGALEMGRKAIGIELKENYYLAAIKNIKELEAKLAQPTLFDLLDEIEQ